MRIRIYISILFFAAAKFASAQDSHFSQYEFSPLSVNPALTGIDKNLHVVVHHRDQWRSLKAYRTEEMSFELRFDPTGWLKVKGRTATYKKQKQKGMAVGLSINSDKAGDGNMNKFACNFSLAYHMVLDEKSRFSAGILGGLKQRSITPSGLRFNSQYDITGAYDDNLQSGENFNYNSVSYNDFSAGLCYSFGSEDMYMEANDNKAFKIGFSTDHLTRPDNVYLLDKDLHGYMRYTLHGSGLFGIKNSRTSVGASVLAMLQGNQKEITVGGLLKFHMKDDSRYTGIKKGQAISVGCYYRIGDALIPYVQYELARYALGISYDLNMSGLTKATTGRGGLEVTLRFFNPVPFLFQKKVKAKMI
ncbi:MAG: PorP/SprF family type IX secretion system membrane protein [Bacteroidia bacterium]